MKFIKKHMKDSISVAEAMIKVIIYFMIIYINCEVVVTNILSKNERHYNMVHERFGDWIYYMLFAIGFLLFISLLKIIIVDREIKRQVVSVFKGLITCMSTITFINLLFISLRSIYILVTVHGTFSKQFAAFLDIKHKEIWIYIFGIGIITLLIGGWIELNRKLKNIKSDEVSVKDGD